MIDAEHIKHGIDCRTLVERDLGKPKYRSSAYSTYKCPLHQEQNGYSLVVYADHWRCFGKCCRGGDAIAWLQIYHGLTFQEACQRLADGDLPHRTPVTGQPRQISVEPPAADWQRAARQIAVRAMDTLWSKAGRRAWRYLEETRGLSEKTIVDARLGYIPGDHREWATYEGLRVPCGITIPWFADHALWGIKVRRAAGERRYQQVSGGSISGGLYLADEIAPGVPLLLTEGEFDALIVRQAGEGLVSAAAIGSAANRRIQPRWFRKLIAAPRILIRMDDDDAGRGAAAQIAGLSQATQLIRVPQGKDVNEFYLLAGHAATQSWIKAMLE